jgi:hypothetical protein
MINFVSALSVEVVWFDEHMLELALSARSAKFAGQTTFYAALDELERFAEHIERFPARADDSREYVFGGGTVSGYGGAKVRLTCKDGAGHLIVQATIYRTSDGGPVRVAESATLEFASVPSAVDSFVESLRHMRVQIGDMAILHHA